MNNIDVLEKTKEEAGGSVEENPLVEGICECGYMFSGNNATVVRRRWTAHRASSQKKKEEKGKHNWGGFIDRASGEPTPIAPGGEDVTGHHDLQKIKLTKNIEEANVLSFVPKRYDVSSNLLLMTKRITELEWGWPYIDDVGDWLDTFFYWVMYANDIRLGAYQVVSREDSNGHS